MTGKGVKKNRPHCLVPIDSGNHTVFLGKFCYNTSLVSKNPFCGSRICFVGAAPLKPEQVPESGVSA